MDVLEQLRSDMCDAAMEATEKKEDEVDACLDILDEFIAGHEVVEVYENPRLVCEPLGEDGFRQWHNDMRQDLSGDQRETIIVPRERKSGLLRAAENAVGTWRKDRERYSPRDLANAIDALAAAIKEDRGGRR